MAENKDITKKKSQSTDKKKCKFSKIIVVLCIVFIMIYTVVQVILSYLLGAEISPTLTTCVYAFFGTELASTAVIKILDKDYPNSKNKESDEPKSLDNHDSTINEDNESVG